MTRYIKLAALAPQQAKYIFPLTPPQPRNHVLLKPSPHQHFLALPKEEIPPNVRIQSYVSSHKKLWEGVDEVDKRGGLKTKDDGKVSRIGRGRSARAKGGLYWATRER
jgi:hypothetical protein